MSEQDAPVHAPGQVLYAEDRCGYRWPMAANAAIGWIAMIAFGITMNLPHLAATAVTAIVGGFWGIVVTGNTVAGLPLGIRVTGDAVSIGGIRSRDQLAAQGKWPPRRPLRTGQQNKAVFTCPWEGVRSLYVITEKKEIRRLRRDYRRFIVKSDNTLDPLGAYRAAMYFSIGALVITTDARSISSDPPTFLTSRGQYGVRIHGVESPTWMIPTRDPEALRAAIERVPGAPRVQANLPSQAIFQFRSG